MDNSMTSQVENDTDATWCKRLTLPSGQTLTIRLARYEDYKCVINIDKDFTFYDGHDYVPELYYELLQKPNAYCFIAELDGTIVHFIILHVIEGGQGLVSCAGRVAAAHRSTGIATIARERTLQIMKSNFPRIQNLSWTGLLWEQVERAAAKTDAPFIIRDRWNFMGTVLTRKDLLRLLSELKERTAGASRTTKVLTLNDLNGIVSSPETCRRLFPAGILYTGVNWMPQTVPNQNAKPFYGDTTFYGIWRPSEGSPTAIGTLCPHPTANYLDMQAFYYGENDMDSFLSWLQVVLADFEKHSVYPRDMSLALSFPTSLDKAKVQLVFKGYNTVRDINVGYIQDSNEMSKLLSKI